MLTRDSVAAGDDIDAPHWIEFEIDEKETAISLVTKILEMDYLACISGGEATWSLVASNPIAVIAQQWEEPKLFAMLNPSLAELFDGKQEVKLRFNYHAQIDPNTAYEVIIRYKLCNS